MSREQRGRQQRRGVHVRSDGTEESRIHVHVPLALGRNARMLAVEQDRDLRDVVADALEEYIRRVDAQLAKESSAG